MEKKEKKTSLFKFNEHLFEVSENKTDIKEALKEWEIVLAEKRFQRDRQCICQHLIKDSIYFFNKKTHKLIVCGTACSKKFNMGKKEMKDDMMKESLLLMIEELQKEDKELRYEKITSMDEYLERVKYHLTSIIDIKYNEIKGKYEGIIRKIITEYGIQINDDTEMLIREGINYYNYYYRLSGDVVSIVECVYMMKKLQENIEKLNEDYGVTYAGCIKNLMHATEEEMVNKIKKIQEFMKRISKIENDRKEMEKKKEDEEKENKKRKEEEEKRKAKEEEENKKRKEEEEKKKEEKRIQKEEEDRKKKEEEIAFKAKNEKIVGDYLLNVERQINRMVTEKKNEYTNVQKELEKSKGVIWNFMLKKKYDVEKLLIKKQKEFVKEEERIKKEREKEIILQKEREKIEKMKKVYKVIYLYEEFNALEGRKRDSSEIYFYTEEDCHKYIKDELPEIGKKVESGDSFDRTEKTILDIKIFNKKDLICSYPETIA
jgi:hypothetical protein